MYTYLLNKLATLPLDSEEYKKVKQQIMELDFASDMAVEFGSIDSYEE